MCVVTEILLRSQTEPWMTSEEISNSKTFFTLLSSALPTLFTADRLWQEVWKNRSCQMVTGPPAMVSRTWRQPPGARVVVMGRHSVAFTAAGWKGSRGIKFTQVCKVLIAWVPLRSLVLWSRLSKCLWQSVLCPPKWRFPVVMAQDGFPWNCPGDRQRATLVPTFLLEH